MAVIQGKYELLRRLGKGGMAEVYLAKQTGLRGFEKLIVLKRILPDSAMDGDFVTMFLDEARTAADLRHPNVINVFDMGRADGTYFMAMEFLHGHDVRQMLKTANKARSWVPLGQIAEIVLGCAAGLHHAHTKTSIDGMPLGIVHRDISPPNILVGFAGEVKVVDFGIAKAANQATQTQAGAIKGKYAYMSPEQAEGKKLDHRSDQFALGVVFWEMLTQRRLFKRGTEPKTLMAVIDDPAPPARQFRADVPPSLDAILKRMLSKKPENRLDSCEQMRTVLEEVIAEEGVAHSTARLAKYMKELFGEPEPEAELSAPQLDPGDVADLSEQFREELIAVSGRAPRKKPKPKVRPDDTNSRSETRHEVPATKPEGETIVDRKSTSRSASKVASSSESEDAEKTASSRARKKPPADAPPPAMDLHDDKTLLLPDGGQGPDAPSSPGGSRRGVLIAAGVVGGLVLVGAGVGIGVAVAGPKEGTVIVRTAPKGASVIVDGKDTGEVTPHILRPRVGSVLKVRVEKSGYAPVTSVVKVTGGEANELILELEKQ